MKADNAELENKIEKLTKDQKEHGTLADVERTSMRKTINELEAERDQLLSDIENLKASKVELQKKM